MRITAFLLLLASLHLSARSVSQTITLTTRQWNLKEIFGAIREQTGYTVIYEKGTIASYRPVSLRVKALPLAQFLELVFKDQPFRYSIVQKIITLSAGSAPLAPSLPELMLPVTGSILNAEGEGLSQVNIVIKGSKNGVHSDASGNFSLNAGIGDVLVISCVGYITQEVKLQSGAPLTIRMMKAIQEMDEIILNKGYYTETKRLSTGNITKVTDKEIEKQPVTNVMTALAGRVPGLELVQSSGMPGASITFRIRGINSIASGNNPLFIVDGVPFSGETLGDPNVSRMQGTGASPFNSLNPSDISAIEVLKDADATAIYGSRGANGVILITTKKGQAGKTKLDITTNTSFSKVAGRLDVMNTEQYLEMRKEAFKNDGITTYPASAYDVNGKWDQNRSTDWQKVLIGRTARNSRMQLSLSGGNSQTQYLLRGGYHRESTVYPGDFHYSRGSVLFNMTHRSADRKFQLTFSNLYSTDDNNAVAKDFTREAIILPPNAPALYKADGSLNWENSTWENPLGSLESKYKGSGRNMNASLMLQYSVLPGLDIKTSLGFNDYRQDEYSTMPSTMYNPSLAYGSDRSIAYANNSQRRSWSIEPQVNWEKKIANGLVQTIIGTSFQQQLTDAIGQAAQGFPSNRQIYDMTAARDYFLQKNTSTLYRYQAVFARVSYNLKNQYLVNLTARRDGSSRFGPGNQFASFGAIGAAWIFSEQNTIKEKLPWISFGKWRGSYGITGNDQIGDYQYLDAYTVNTKKYIINGLKPQRLYNPEFAWETNKKLELALELGFLSDRIMLFTSWYQNRSSNQLVGIPLPAITGFTSIIHNFNATVQNRGIELELRTVNIQRKNLRWTSSFNLTRSRNKLISFPDLQSSTYANQYIIGQSISIVKNYNFLGFDPLNGAYLFEDLNKDGIISSPSDRKKFKDLATPYFGGFSNNIALRNWQLDFTFQFIKQLKRGYLFNIVTPGAMRNLPVSTLNRWKKAGDNAIVQPYTTVNALYMDRHYQVGYTELALDDASFIRLKNIALSYTIPESWSKAIRCQLFIQAQNLFTITKFVGGPDPETVANSLPILKTVNLGAQFTF